MKIIKFLKPDLKRIIVMTIIFSPLLATFIRTSNDEFFGTLVMFVLFPAIIVGVILFGGFDMMGSGLLPSLLGSNISFVVLVSILVLFWYIISCVVVTVWAYISNIDS
jgi:hypothetical protein